MAELPLAGVVQASINPEKTVRIEDSGHSTKDGDMKPAYDIFRSMAECANYLGT